MTGQLLTNLESAGLAASDIDIVLLTHLHPDHIGGALDSDGKPVFDNASHTLCADDGVAILDKLAQPERAAATSRISFRASSSSQVTSLTAPTASSNLPQPTQRFQKEFRYSMPPGTRRAVWRTCRRQQ